MPSDIIPSAPGGPRPGDGGHGHGSLPGDRGREAGRASEPASTPVYPSSGDDLSVSLSQSLTRPLPDPFLEELDPDDLTPPGTPETARSRPEGPSGEGASGPSHASEGEALWGLIPPSSSDALAGLDLRGQSALDQITSVARTPKSFDAMTALQQAASETPSEPNRASGPPSSLEAFSAIALDVAPSPATEPDLEEDEDLDLPPRRVSWLVVLLASYASAVTLGLIWVLWGNRVRQAAEVNPFPPAPADTRPDPGRHALDSRKIVPSISIAPDRMTSLGRPVRMGALEATPLEVVSGEVEMKRRFRARERRSGGEEALKLRIRLRNVSSDTVFAPLDEAFLRVRESGVVDSFIMLRGGGRIELFPLAVESEWAIVGQDFRELGPGEALEALIVSASDALDRTEDEMTWRIRLRTGIDQTDMLGVRFADHEIQPE